MRDLLLPVMVYFDGLALFSSLTFEGRFHDFDVALGLRKML